MLRQDYVMRLIEQFSTSLTRLLETILRRGTPGEAIHEEIAAIARQCALDLDVARRLDRTMLLTWLGPTGDIDAGRFWLMGELLFLEGRQSLAEGAADRARADLERAHAVFSRLEPAWQPQPDLAAAGDRVTAIETLLHGPGAG
jgi:hypothetical protein